MYVAFQRVTYFAVISSECGEVQKFDNTSFISKMDFNDFSVSEKYSQWSLQDNQQPQPSSYLRTSSEAAPHRSDKGLEFLERK